MLTFALPNTTIAEFANNLGSDHLIFMGGGGGGGKKIF